MLSYEGLKTALASEPLPLAAVDLDAFDRNVETVSRLAAGKPVRVATKSIRVPDLILRVLDRGAPFKGLMCGSAKEARFLAELGFDDFLIAYPTLDAAQLRALRELHDTGKKAVLVVDSREGLAALEAAMNGAKTPFPVAIEADVSASLGPLMLGAMRSPLRDANAAAAFAKELAAFPSLRLKGIMAYESFTAGVGDRSPFKPSLNPVLRLLRKNAQAAARAKRKALAERFSKDGLALELFNGGGSGSLSYAADEAWLTELAAGSAFLCPHLFDYFSNLKLEPAGFFALEAVRRPAPDTVTCRLGGYIASGEPGFDRVPQPWLPEGAKLRQAEACGEVQTPVRLPTGTALKLGEPVFFRHAKGGEPAEHFDEYLLLSGGKVSHRAKTYRGLGKTFY